jgi:rubredoxin---NAD+ reductase
LAVGAIPRRLPLALAQHCWQINQLQDYQRLMSHLADKALAQRIVVIGAGLVGIELADDLSTRGHQTTIIEYEDRPLAQLASRTQSDELLIQLGKNGIAMHMHTQVRSIERTQSGAYQVNIANRLGTQTSHPIDADIVIAAVGLEADKRLAQHSGLSFADGFSIDPSSMQTNVRGIYALGDCASVDGRAQRYIEPIARQAQTIVHNILGLEAQPFISKKVPIRLKSRSHPMTFR